MTAPAYGVNGRSAWWVGDGEVTCSDCLPWEVDNDNTSGTVFGECRDDGDVRLRTAVDFSSGDPGRE